MIRYRLKCNKKHEFEAWFGSSTAYDRQEKAGQVTCPHCGSKKVSKTLMSPGVATSERKAKRERAPEPAPSTEVATLQTTQATDPRSEMQRQFLALMREIRKEVEAKAEYVGPKFADEARKIHLQETEARGIWGEATLDEAKELLEDGIDCLPLPRLPEEKN